MMSRVDMEHLRFSALVTEEVHQPYRASSAQSASVTGPARVPADSVDGLRTVPNVPMQRRCRIA
jgi:hypothetical protein